MLQVGPDPGAEMILEEIASLWLRVPFSSVWASFSSRLSPGSSKEAPRSSSCGCFQLQYCGRKHLLPYSFWRQSQCYVHWPGLSHSQFLNAFIVARDIQSTDWSGLGHVTRNWGVGSLLPNPLRAGVPQRKIKVQFLKEGRIGGQIKAHHLYKHHLECRERASKSVPSGWLR